MLVDIDTIIPKNGSYVYLINEFGEEKITSRYEHLYLLLKDFIEQKQYGEYVDISIVNLNHIIVDYFVDISRLKPFQEIKLVNEPKIHAYLANWILRHKPLQQKNNDNESMVFVNEEFVTDYILSYLLKEITDYPLLDERRESVEEFAKTMRYYFQYRSFTAQSIELMLLSFIAGRGFQYSVDNQK